MNKAKFIELIAAEAEVKKAVAARTLKAMVDVITKTLAEEGGEVLIPGLGKLETKHRPGRNGRNPQTGALIKIGPKRVVVFRVSRTLKQIADSHKEKKK